MKNRRVEVLIDELALHGFQPSDRDAIAEALQRELGRLVQTSHLAEHESTISVETLRAPRAAFPAQARPAFVGMQAARAIFSGLNGLKGSGDRREG